MDWQWYVAGVSGCVICYQEADRIVDCVRSLAFCDEVVVVDSGSTDGTVELAQRLGALLLRDKLRLERVGHVLEKVPYGFAGMVLESVLILNYQTASGALFQDLGVLLTMFMAGLATGALAVDRWFR